MKKLLILAFCCASSVFGVYAQTLNDDCSTAKPLSLTLVGDSATTATRVSFADIQAATRSSEGLQDILGSNEDDLWFSFSTPTSIATVVVNSSTNYDAIVEMYNGNCNELNFVFAANNVFDASTEYLKLTHLIANETYYIRVYDKSENSASTQSDFSILVTEKPLCGTVSNPLQLTYTYEDDTLRAFAMGGTPPYQYHWIDADNNESLFYKVGRYAVNDVLLLGVMDSDGCSIYGDIVVGQTPLSPIVGVDKVALADYKMSVFPNPATHSAQLTLETINDVPMTIQISNTLGQILSSEVVFGKGDMVFDLKISDLPNGIYFVSVMSEKGIQSKELIIAR